MTIGVLLFARYAELAGQSRLEIEADAGITVGGLWERIRAACPALADETTPLFACDREYVGTQRVIGGGEEIAVFPPVSGG